ncbi:MAG: hypothetical protein AB7G28_13360 [Pirellulales bacterium]
MSAVRLKFSKPFGDLQICSAVAAVCLAVVCAGCGPTTSTVNGRVTMDGKPLAISDDARGTIVFHPAGGQGATATGLLDRTGNFHLGIGASSNIVPGRYQVAISIVELVPATDGSEPRGKRVTPAKYSSAIDSGLQADVALGENDFTFDMSSAEEEATKDTPADQSATAPSESDSQAAAPAAAGTDAASPAAPEK